MQILKDEIREKILIAAENIFYQKGFKETTTRSIASEVGISVSNLYLYYENKESLFYAVTDGFYNFFIKGMETFLTHHEDDALISVNISDLLQKIIIVDQKKFVIITAKSQGTKYEGSKAQIIGILQKHINEKINKNIVQDQLLTYIFAKNFIEGLIEIAKNYKDELWLEESINILVKYHMYGMIKLM